MSEEQNKITVYRTNDKDMGHPGWVFDTASSRRDWMDTYKHMYRCLPMTIANQSGWVIEAPCDIYAIWFGGNDPKTSMHFWLDPQYTMDNIQKPWVKCHFIGGIITFEFDFVIRTNEKVNLLVRGAPNFIREGLHPLEGIVETDWLNFSFTMNWRVEKPGQLVSFKKGDPICFIQPIPHNYSESFDFEIDNIENNSDLNEKYQEYYKSRIKFGNDKAQGLHDKDWQKHYFNGVDVKTQEKVTDDVHSIKLNLKKPIDQKIQIPHQQNVQNENKHQLPPEPAMDNPESLLTTTTTVVGTPNLKVVK